MRAWLCRMHLQHKGFLDSKCATLYGYRGVVSLSGSDPMSLRQSATSMCLDIIKCLSHNVFVTVMYQIFIPTVYIVSLTLIMTTLRPD